MLIGKHNCIEKNIVKPVFKYTNLSFNKDVYDWSDYYFRFDKMECDYQDTYISFNIDLNKYFYRKCEEEFKFNKIYFLINHKTKIGKSSNEPTLFFYNKVNIKVELHGYSCKRLMYDYSFSFDFNTVIKRLKYDYKHAIEEMVGYVFSEFKKHCEFRTENNKFDKYVKNKVF